MTLVPRDTFGDAVPSVDPLTRIPQGIPLRTYRTKEHKPITGIMRTPAFTSPKHSWRAWHLWSCGEDYVTYRTTIRESKIEEITPSNGFVLTAQLYRNFNTSISKILESSTDMLGSEIRAALEELHPCQNERKILNIYWPLFTQRSFGFMFAAPVDLTAKQADEAGTTRLTTAELAASVRFENGRWVIETGAGGTLVHHGAVDTQEEAVALARAIRDRAWIDAVERITESRGGSLDWGLPIPIPYKVRIYP